MNLGQSFDFDVLALVTIQNTDTTTMAFEIRLKFTENSQPKGSYNEAISAAPGKKTYPIRWHHIYAPITAGNNVIVVRVALTTASQQKPVVEEYKAFTVAVN
jgi:hypothetical protein